MPVRHPLRLSAIETAIIDPEAPQARECLMAYVDELAVRFPEGYAAGDLITAADAREPAGVSLVAMESADPVGCGVLLTPSVGYAEIRHLWVHSGARGIGLGRRLLVELEHQAVSGA